jgi:hypothetical protein
MATDHTTSQKNGSFLAGLVPLANRVTIAAGATGTYHQFLDIVKGDTVLAFAWKLIQGGDKVATIQFGLEGGDTDGFAADTTIALAAEDAVTQGAGALLGTANVAAAADTIDGLITVAAGPMTVDVIIDVQAVVLRNEM